MLTKTFKYIIILLLLFISSYYFYKGIKSLKKIIPNKEKFTIIKKEAVNENRYDNKINEKSILEKKINITQKQIKEIYIIKKNDTFSKIIEPFFKEDQIKNSIINKVNKLYNLKKIKIGQKIYFYSNQNNEINQIVFSINFSTDLIINISNSIVVVNKEILKNTKELHSAQFTISSSLYKDGIIAQIPIKILTDVIKLYSFDIDFQRDIKKNTKFYISYEILVNEKRKNVSYENIKYLNLVLQNKNLEYFLFKTEEGFFDYFNKKGKNIKKTIMKTPIDGAKLSSKFGMRKHPILGYSKLHKGIDFAAPKGTPVYAGGNGVVEYANYNGGFGKYIRIRHNSEYKTAYAHLSNFHKNIAKGKRVSQGDIIGYVGSTGNSTGPHLHYEILFQNMQINPMKMKLPSGKTLQGSELDKFNKEAKEIYAEFLYNLHE